MAIPDYKKDDCSIAAMEPGFMWCDPGLVGTTWEEALRLTKATTANQLDVRRAEEIRQNAQRAFAALRDAASPSPSIH
jgi:hypothetical protein